MSFVTGRTLARILQQVPSQMFPPDIFWDSAFWGKYAQCDFAEVARCAQEILDKKRQASQRAVRGSSAST